jgi:V/A-type H+-transporting ATPase subunit K
VRRQGRWARSPRKGEASSAIGALAEKPELFGRLLILVGLAEGIAIYGVIISVLILNRLV